VIFRHIHAPNTLIVSGSPQNWPEALLICPGVATYWAVAA